MTITEPEGPAVATPLAEASPPMAGGGVRSAVKGLLNGGIELLMLPMAAAYWGLARLAPGRADITFTGFSQLASLWPGVVGQFFRRGFYRWTFTECPRDCSIGFGTTFATADVRIGARTYIGDGCNIGHAIIGPDVLIGSNVDILSGKEQHFFDRLDVPIGRQGGRFRHVTIGRDVWIGNSAIVMENVADQAVVAAGAVVTKPVAGRAIVGGIPARVLGERGASAVGTLTVEIVPVVASPVAPVD